MNLPVVVAGMVRERNLLLVGEVILGPVQRLEGVWLRVAARGILNGCTASRVGRRSRLSGMAVLLDRIGGEARRADKKSVWNAIPDMPSPSA